MESAGQEEGSDGSFQYRRTQNTDGSRGVAPRLHSTFADHRERPQDAHPVEPRTLQWSMGIYSVQGPE